MIYAPRSSFGPRIQTAYQLVLVHGGLIRVEVDGTPRLIPAGHVGLLRPGCREYFGFDPDRRTRHSWVAVPPHLLDGELRANVDASPSHAVLSVAMQRCVEACCAVAAADDTEDRRVLAASGRSALTLYAAETIRGATTAAREHPALTRMRMLVRERAVQGIGVAALAHEIHLSPEHLIRLCRRELGTTPGALLRAERLAQAMQLLAHTGLPVGEVAHRCGFASQQHLARGIRGASGLTPSGFRRRSWQARDETRCDVPQDG